MNNIPKRLSIIFSIIFLFVFTTTTSHAGNVTRAGVRSSFYGATLNPDSSKINIESSNWMSAHDQPYPSKGQWEEVTKNVANNFSSTRPTVIWIVGESDGGTGCKLSFNPGVSLGSYITQEPPYVPPYSYSMHDEYMQYFSDNGIDVFLQVEPGHANVGELIDIVLNHFGDYSAVVGFGVDVEFYKYNPSNYTNQPVSDATAQSWEAKVKSHNPNYRLFLKHFFASAMPQNYRGDIIFVDDIQDMGNKSDFLSDVEGNGMIDFANAFYPNEVIFQIGYPADWYYSGSNGGYNPTSGKSPWYESTYGTNPQSIFDGLTRDLKNATNSNQDIGFIWVDFTMRKLYPNSFLNTTTSGNYYFKMNWYNAAAVTTITMVSPVYKELKTITGYYPDTGSAIYLGWFSSGKPIELEIKSYWRSQWFGPVSSYDNDFFKVIKVSDTRFKYTFEDAVGYDNRYNDGEFEVYKQ